MSDGYGLEEKAPLGATDVGKGVNEGLRRKWSLRKGLVQTALLAGGSLKATD
jgi:hypothetical protein